jgi:hypothetical protein
MPEFSVGYQSVTWPAVADSVGRDAVVNLLGWFAYGGQSAGATVAVDMRTHAVTVSTDGQAVVDAGGALLVLSSDQSTITAYDLNRSDARQLWQVPVPLSSGFSPAPLFTAGGYLVASTNQGLIILR